VVGEPHGGHLELGRARRQGRDPAGAVEDRVLAVDVEMDELGGHGKAIVGGPSAGTQTGPRRSTGVTEPPLHRFEPVRPFAVRRPSRPRNWSGDLSFERR
jgi:hypothetical protein